MLFLYRSFEFSVRFKRNIYLQILFIRIWSWLIKQTLHLRKEGDRAFVVFNEKHTFVGNVAGPSESENSRCKDVFPALVFICKQCSWNFYIQMTVFSLLLSRSGTINNLKQELATIKGQFTLEKYVIFAMWYLH